MRIVDRHSRRMRMFRGGGAWILLAPLRYILSRCYGIYSRLAQERVREREGTGRIHSSPRVISIGNIEVGGGGKTPCAMAISSALSGMGQRPVVVAGGYGGSVSAEGSGCIVGGTVGERCRAPRGYIIWEGGGEREAAAVLGDEAVLYWQEGIPVVVDRNRKRGIEAASLCFDPTHVILDDAFHHKDLAKDLDIILLDHEKPFGGGRLLPYGTLREPVSAVSRADAVIFTRSTDGSIPREAAPLVDGKPVFHARHVPVRLSGIEGEEDPDPRRIGGSPVALFSGIARPDSFESASREFGLDPIVSFRFDDHHPYEPSDIEGMISETGGAAAFVTTAKDWSKSVSLFPDGVKVLKLKVEMRIEGIEELLRAVG